jgi:hypothetical protein
MDGKTVDCVRVKGLKKTATVPNSDGDGDGNLPF